MKDKSTCDDETDVKIWKEINEKLFKRNCGEIPYQSYKNDKKIVLDYVWRHEQLQIQQTTECLNLQI
jgi:hypothetical protein